MGDDYNPHDHRVEHLSHPTNNFETLFHLVKGCLGTGVLAMPEAFKFAGMWVSIIAFVIIAIFSTYCIHVLVRGQYVLCKKKKVGLLVYADTMVVACEFGPPALRSSGNAFAIMVNFFMIFYQTGTCCIYWVFFGSNFKYVLDVYVNEPTVPMYVIMLALFLPFFLILCVRNLKLLAPFSIFADIVMLITFGVTFYYIFINLDASFLDRPATGNIVDFPLFFGTALFALQSVPVLTAVENNMGTPDFFRKPVGALNVGFATLSLIYIFVGIFGYWRYGEDIKSSITMNFPPEHILAQVIILSYCLAIYFTYGVNAFVPIDIIQNQYIVPSLKEDATEFKKLSIEMCLRTAYCIITGTLATTVPLLGLIISLCGSVGMSALGMIFPGLIEICAYWETGETRVSKFAFWKNIGIIIVGVLGLLAGLSSTLKSMYEKISAGDYN